MTTRVLIADEHRLVREAMRDALVAEAGMQVIAEAGDGYRAVNQTQQYEPDVALLHVDLPGLSGVDACMAIKSSAVGTRVIVVSETADDDLLLAAIEAGADGYVGADGGFEELVSAVRRVQDGQVLVPPHLLGGLLKCLIMRRRAADRALEHYMRLTPREKEVLNLLVEGHDHVAIANFFVISPQTARTHIQNLLRKLEVHSRLEAVALAIEHGWVEPELARRSR